MGDFKSPGLIGRTFFNDGLQIRRNAWRWTYCSERLTVDLLFGTPGVGQGETCKCQGTIQHQKLIAELIAHILRVRFPPPKIRRIVLTTSYNTPIQNPKPSDSKKFVVCRGIPTM